MTYHDDPDLERRLRRIAESPEPPVPGSVLRYAEQVTTRRRGFQMHSSSVMPRRGLVLGLAAVSAVLVLAAGFSFALRNANNGVAGGPTASVSAPATSATPAETPTPTGTPGATTNATSFATAGATAGWSGFSFGRLPAGSPMIADEEMDGTGVGQVLRWKGGYAATASATMFGETRPSRGLWTSPDGETWSAAVGIDAPAVLVSAAPAGLVALAVPPFSDGDGAPSSAWTSSDGLSWHDAGKPDLPGRLLSIAGTDRAIVATVEITTGTLKSQKTTYQILYSTDGISWTPQTVSSVLSSARLAYGLPPHVQTDGSRFYLMGSGVVAEEPVDEMWLSDDGKTWTKSAGGYQLYADYIDFGRDGMVLHTNVVAAPGANLQAYSTDGGKTWHDDAAFSPLGQSKCEGMCGTTPDGVIGSNGTVFVAVKNGGTQAWLSYDGHTWSPIPWAGGTPEYPVEGAGATYGGRGFLVMPRGVYLNGVYGAAK